MNEHATGNRDSSSDRWAVLAGLRFVLAMVVIFAHIGWFCRRTPFLTRMESLGGTHAVLAFLIVSGYSIAASAPRSSAREFYARRFWRIYPVYLAGVALALLPYLLSNLVHPEMLPQPTDAWAVGLDLTAIPWLGVPVISMLPQAYSLYLEVAFYAVAPLLVRCSRRTILGLAAVSAALFCWQPPNGDGGVIMPYYLNMAWPWLLGWAWYRWPERNYLRAAVLLVPFYIFGWHPNVAAAHGDQTLLAACAVIAYADRIRVPAAWVPTMLYLGDLSFPIYMVHFAVGCTARAWLGWDTLLLQLGAILLVAAAVHHGVEVPIRTMRRRCSTVPASA